MFAGEILIGGRSYLNEEEMTKDKFFNNRFEPASDIQHGRNVSYHTGDMAIPVRMGR